MILVSIVSFNILFIDFDLDILSWNRNVMISYAMSYGMGKDMISNTLSLQLAMIVDIYD